MGKLKIIIFLVIILLFLGAGFYFRNDILNFFPDFKKNIQDFRKTDVGVVITEFSKEILTPPPLEIGGKPSQAVLTKSGIILQTNLQRQEKGNLLALKESAKLAAAASAKVNDMFLNQYFEHNSPAGVDPGQLVLNYGYKYIIAGENLILGNFESEKELVQAWMDSPGHRANILNNRYTEIGVAVVKGTYKGEAVWMGVQEFGLPLSSCAGPSAVLKNEINDKKIQLDVLLAQIDQKKNQIENTKHNSPAYSQMVDDYNQAVAQYNSLAEQIKSFVARFNEQVNIFNTCAAGK